MDKLIPVGVWVQREYLFACFALGDGDDGNECVDDGWVRRKGIRLAGFTMGDTFLREGDEGGRDGLRGIGPVAAAGRTFIVMCERVIETSTQ